MAWSAPGTRGKRGGCVLKLELAEAVALARDATLTFILCIKVDPSITVGLLHAQIASCLAVQRACLLVGLNQADPRLEAMIAPWVETGRVALHVLHDRSLYDGWNKSVALAATPEVAFLGYGDCILNPGYFDEATLADVDVMFARALIYDPDGDRIHGRPFNRLIHSRRQLVAMIGAIFRRELLLAHPFDARLKIVGDWELLLRLGPQLRAEYRRVITVSMPGGGMSEGQLGKVMDEVRQVRAERRKR